MLLCFICNSKLISERTRVCSSVTPYSNVPFTEKVAELLGEEFVVIVNPADQMCQRCTSLLNYMDKMENDLKLVRNELITCIRKKYGLLPAEHPVKTLDVINGNLNAEDALETGEKIFSSGLTTVRDNSVHTPLKLLKIVTPQQQQSFSILNIYKCKFCSYKSRNLGYVCIHMRTHVNEDGKEVSSARTKPITQAPRPPLLSHKKRIYRCQICLSSFDSKFKCLKHIQRDHTQLKSTTGNVGRNSAEGDYNKTQNTEEEPSQGKYAQVDQVVSKHFNLEVEGDNGETVLAETKSEYMDVESMLVAIHEENTPANNALSTLNNSFTQEFYESSYHD